MSRDYGFELQQILSNVNHLKGLVAKLGITTTAVPTVDFVCDMFDRTDSAVLNGYWGDTTGSWALVNQRAIFQGPETAVQLSTFQLVSAVSGVVGNILCNFASGSTILTHPQPGGNFRSNLYSAKMSTRDFQVKVTFDVKAPSSPVTVSSTQVVANSGLGPGTNAVLNTTFTTYPQFTGIALGSATVGRVLAISYTGTVTPAISIPAFTSSATDNAGSTSSVTTPAYSVAAGNSLTGQFGLLSAAGTSGQPIQSATTFPTAGQTSTGTSFAASSTPAAIINASTTESVTLSTAAARVVTNSAAPPVVAGTNTLLVQMAGNAYNVYLNGVLWQSITQAIMTDRAQPGLLSQVSNMLGYLVTQGITPYGISSFKAWPMGMGEPLDQSGHGTYASGYSDKYHATGSYNPLA